jgi:cobalt-zinc-cadmium efflux system outer membrane protein
VTRIRWSLRLLALPALALSACSSEPPAQDTGGPAARDLDAEPAATRRLATTIDPDVPLTVDECVKLAQTSSLTARAFKARLEAARGTAEAASAWPNPTFEYNVEDIGTVLNRQRQLLQQEILHYPIFTFWTKGLEADVAKADEARTAAEVEDDRRQLKFDVGQAFYELLASEQAVMNERAAVAVATSLVAAAEKRRKVGEASVLDEQRARTELLEARRDLAAAHRKRVVDGIAFALALGAERPVPVNLAEEWPEALPAEVADVATETLVQRALATRPDVQEAEASVLKAQKSADLEGRKTLPLADWQLAGGISQGPEGRGAIVNFQAPVPLLDFNTGNRTRARAELESAVVSLEKTRRMVVFEVESSLVAFDHAHEALEEFARPIEAARASALDATRRQFQAGEVTYFELVQAQRDLVAARRELVDARKELALARWRLLTALVR